MTTSPRPAAGHRLDPHFHWRAHEVSRVEAIADAVFGLVLAMLLLNEHPPESFGAMFGAVKALVPFAVTFLLVAMVWFQHWLFFRRYGLHDMATIALTFLLLFLVVGFAYPLKLVFTSLAISFFGPIGELTNDKVAHGVTAAGPVFVVYSAGFCAVYLTLAGLYVAAWRHREALQLDEIERFLTRSTAVSMLLMTVVGALSLSLALLAIAQGDDCFIERTKIAGWIYFLIGPLQMVHGSWQGRTLRRLGCG